jgi:UDP-N-acetylmuramoyl-tripeptide--D-alanyl-D-alanine ligase
MTIAALHEHFLKNNSVCTDTRKLKKGDLFFALKGDSFNGNTFADDALDKGASLAVVDEEGHSINPRCILVDNALTTLQQLANHHRRYLALRIIALTGSNGKTTTKELIQSVLSKKYKAVATMGNLNNHIGVPLTLLSMDTTTEIGIVEMGANHLKEIKALCAIAEPDFGYITNFGKAHLEGFGSFEGVILGKSELYDHLKDNDKIIFINTDDEQQVTQLGDYPKYYRFGSKTNSSKGIELLAIDPFVEVKYNRQIIRSRLIGEYNFNNIAAAIAIGAYFNVDTTDIKLAIESYMPKNNRSQIIKRGSNTIVLDAYNANPTSMKAALDSFARLENGRKVVILGDMFELGSTAFTEHQAIVDYAGSLDFERLLLVGENFFGTVLPSNKAEHFKNFEDLKNSWTNLPLENCCLLIKGSRGMALERVLELL